MSAPPPGAQRPVDPTPRHTEDLPDTPQRDRTILVDAWLGAPGALRRLGHDLPGSPPAEYKRRIGDWLLWRAGPARGGHARYWAGSRTTPGTEHTFHLDPDGTGEGTGPSGIVHHRFRAWKEDLRDHPSSSSPSGDEDRS